MKVACVYHSIDLDGWMSTAIVKHWFLTNENNESYIVNGVRHDRGGNIHIKPKSLTFIGYNYGQLIPDLSGYDKVIMCDISFPFEQLNGMSKSRMYQLYEKLNTNFIWIDHNISAIKDNIGIEYINEKGEDTSTLFNGLRHTNFAACELTWNTSFLTNPCLK